MGDYGTMVRLPSGKHWPFDGFGTRTLGDIITSSTPDRIPLDMWIPLDMCLEPPKCTVYTRKDYPGQLVCKGRALGNTV